MPANLVVTMTHDELLAKIEKVKDYCEGAVLQVHNEFCISDRCKCSEMETAQNGIYKALRAVVELCTENTDHHLIDKDWVLNAIKRELLGNPSKSDLLENPSED